MAGEAKQAEVGSMMVATASTYADACGALTGLIAVRYGIGVELLDDLTFKVMRCPHIGSNRVGCALIAWPTEEGATQDNVIAAYYGEPLRLQDAR
jgi:hypothetical protein